LLEQMSVEQKRYCPRCKSDRIVKGGKHVRLKGVVQRYKCNLCGTTFSNDGYFRGKHQIALLQYAAVLYEQGLSYEKIQCRLRKEFNMTVSRVSIGNWVKMLGLKPRNQSCGNQKSKVFREIVEVGLVTFVRVADSFHPEKLLLLDNSTEKLLDVKP